MIESVDHYFFKQYDKVNYNCVHLLKEAWLEETGQDIGPALEGWILPPSERHIRWKDRRDWKRLDEPRTPCMVLMSRVGLAEPHVGIYLRGRVLHIHRIATEYVPIEVAARGFSKIRFYAP